jgi:hypothetical protein
MQNKYLVLWLLLAGCLIGGFLCGWQTKGWISGKSGRLKEGAAEIRIHDTIKTPVVAYKIIPGVNYNVDSLTEVINKFWKDSLKNLYGMGIFEAKFTKDDKIGRREITLASRIPVDPEAEVTLTEVLKLPEVYPKRTFGVYTGLSYVLKEEMAAHAGVKYYVMDFRNFSLAGFVESKYLLSNKTWLLSAKTEIEVRF